MKKLFFIALFGFFLIPFNLSAQAENTDLNEYFDIYLDKATIAKGYTVAGFDDSLKLSLVPGILNDDTKVGLIELNEDLPMPWNHERISPVYQFEFFNKSAYDDHEPFYIQVGYEQENNDYKQVFYYDNNFSNWRPLPTKDYPEERFVRSLIHLPFARIAVFSQPGVLMVGKASWYSYKSGNFSASPDFPKGSRLRVTNIENDKFVDVEINDWGPDRYLHPDRVVDLEKNAFMKIASLGAGIIDVKVEPLYITPDDKGEILGVSEEGVGELPSIGLLAGVVMNEKSGEIYWEKNATNTLPLASLTKMLAIKVFLDTKPSLNRVVAYSDKDAEYNYQYCKPWESAKLNIEDGETLAIEDLVYAALVGSANNAVETLVRVSGLSRAQFIEKMNKTAKSYGASTTHFVEPTGLSPENVSSPLDYAIITKEVLKHPLIEKACTMEEYRFTTINKEVPHLIRNTNKIIRTDKFAVNGSKTGYLDEAGYCLMTRVKASPDANIIVATFNASSRNQSFEETEKLIQYGLRQL